MAPARAPLLVALFATALPAAAAAKDANTIVYAAFGDWGWSTTGANNSILTNSLSATCKNYNLSNYQASPSTYAACLDGDKAQQGSLIVGGLQQVSQIATAKAMAAACTAAGGCDFLINTGDNFYDLGITGGNTDPQWGAFQTVYTKALFGNNTPFLGTLGNHDYSILNPTAAASQIAYMSVDPRWYIPDHKYARTFTSASGAVSIQVVQVDSTPLIDRYLFSGASGGGYATDASGPDTVPNANAVNAVINAGITPANGWNASNGWTNGNVYNTSNFMCGQCSAGFNTTQCGYNFTTGKALNTSTGPFGVPSGCKYASSEIAALAHPAARSATWANVTSSLTAGYGVNQYQVMFSHFPVLSAQQRLNPWYDNATAAFSTLGAAAPQIVYNGHDHIMAHLKNSAITTAGGQPISFITTGAAGISDYGKSVSASTSPAPWFNATTYPASGYTTSTDGTGALQTLINKQYSAMPSANVAAAAAYNPDVNNTQFWSDFNGFTLSTVNATFMRVDFYLVNCTTVITTGACTNTIGPLNTQYYPAKNITSTATTYVSAAYTLAGYSVSTFNAAAATAFIAAVAADLSVAASAVTITSVTNAPASGRHLLQGSVIVAFSVATPTSGAAAVSAGIQNGIPTTLLVSAGLSSATGVTVSTSPSLTSTAPMAASISSSAATVKAGALALAAAVLALAL